jgi:hypothetical protein
MSWTNDVQICVSSVAMTEKNARFSLPLNSLMKVVTNEGWISPDSSPIGGKSPRRLHPLRLHPLRLLPRKAAKVSCKYHHRAVAIEMKPSEEVNVTHSHRNLQIFP